MMQQRFRLGVLVNPYAGIGGALALKGSDGAEIRAKALAAGAEQLAMNKMTLALQQIANYPEFTAQALSVYTAGGDMGETSCQHAGLECHVIYQPQNTPTEAQDTEQAVQALLAQGIDLLLFAGGDGTARNVCAEVGDAVPVLGVPAGCKIHSGVFGVTPSAAGTVVAQMAGGQLVSELRGEVRDINEDAFRQGKVIAQHYGELRIPKELTYIQAVKMGGIEHEALILDDIADDLLAEMEEHPDAVFVMGSGSTVAAIMERIGLDNTLLGVDVVQDKQLLASDVTAHQLEQLTANQSVRLVITPIGGQGHIIGRGNQQLSPTFLRSLARSDFRVVATKQKLQSLAGKPLRVDSSDPALDASLAGTLSIITGYQDRVLYPIA